MKKARPTPATVAFGGSALESLLAETVSLSHRLRIVAEHVHEQGETSAGKLGVLRGLDLFGAQTVPQIARARPVSRQYIQVLVDELAAEGHVEFLENPAHKRSRLVRLTPKGKNFLDAAIRRQGKLLARLKIGIPEKDLRSAASVLRTLRAFFEGEHWKRMVKRARG